MTNAAARPYSYDEVIYPSRAVAYTHPAAMATLAHLLGLDPAPIERCRVLELGAGTGGNLVPMAANLPGSRFVGYDLSERQVEKGRELARSLGLDNVALQQGDLLALGPELDEFDYIICHGVYSWVRPEVQRRILALCREHLAPQGLAAISYNVLPGWQVRSTFHRLLKLRDEPTLPASARVERAVETLRELRREMAARTDPRSLWLTAELTSFNQMDQSYFFHEYLEAINEPLYFDEFVGQLEAADLRYVGNLHTRHSRWAHWPQGAPERDEASVLLQEAERDLVKWTRFRCTLVGRSELPVQRAVDPERLYSLSVSMRMDGSDLTIDMDADGPMTLIDAQQNPHILRHGLEHVARALLDASPAALSFDDLFELLPAEGDDGPWTRRRFAERLLELYFANGVHLHSNRPPVRKTLSERPSVHELTRLEAREDEWVTNAWHDRVKLGTLHRIVVQLLDGRHDQQEIEASVRARFASGELSLNPPGAPIEKVISAVRPVLEELGRVGVLID
jgi:trans-aconitate methyltransferase